MTVFASNWNIAGANASRDTTRDDAPDGVVTCTITGTPAITPLGTSTFNCVGLMYEIAAGTPSTVTPTPSSCSGSLPPTISSLRQVRAMGAKFVPVIDTQLPPLSPGA